MLRRLLMHPRLIVRFVSLEGLALIAMYAGWSMGYLFLPEGVLRMKSGAALLAGSEPAASLWLEFARIAAINLAVVALFVLLPNRILSVNGYPLGYLPPLFWSAHYGALLGSNSFTYPMAQRLAPTLDVFGRSWVYEIAAYCLALTGREEEGRAFTAVVRQTLPNFRVEDFLSRFRFAPDAEALFREGAKRLDFER